MLIPLESDNLSLPTHPHIHTQNDEIMEVSKYHNSNIVCHVVHVGINRK